MLTCCGTTLVLLRLPVGTVRQVHSEEVLVVNNLLVVSGIVTLPHCHVVHYIGIVRSL